MTIKEAHIKWEDGLLFATDECPGIPRKYYEQEVVFGNVSAYYRRPISECTPAEFEAQVDRLSKWLNCQITGAKPTRAMTLERNAMRAKWEKLSRADLENDPEG